jgi:hypothetical protein
LQDEKELAQGLRGLTIDKDLKMFLQADQKNPPETRWAFFISLSPVIEENDSPR